MTWVIPHASAAGTLYHASDDYSWFRFIVAFEKGVCEGIDADTAFNWCGEARLSISGDGQFSSISGERSIGADETELQPATSALGTNKIIMSTHSIDASALYRVRRHSDAFYKMTALYVDLRTCWRIGQALSKLNIRGQARIRTSVADMGGFCNGCEDVFVAWQTDWVSANQMHIIPIDLNYTFISRNNAWTELFNFDMNPNGAAL